MRIVEVSEREHGSQMRRAYRWPPNVHRTAQGKFLGRFNFAGVRWYSGTWATIEEAERSVYWMRQRLTLLQAHGVALTGLREAEIHFD